MSEIRLLPCPRCDRVTLHRLVEDPDLDGFRCSECRIRWEHPQRTISGSIRE